MMLAQANPWSATRALCCPDHQHVLFLVRRRMRCGPSMTPLGALHNPALDMPKPPDAHAKTDAELVLACRTGDAMAWEYLIRRFRRLVHGIPRAMGLQPADADEVFQHTFSELFRALPSLREPDRVEAWLVTASRRATLRLLRDQRRRTRLAERSHAEDPDRHAPAADERIERLREGERVLRALESLDEACRMLLTALFSDSGESYRALSSRLGLATGSLGSKRARCLQRLRSRLHRDRSVRPPAGPEDRERSRGRA